MKRSLVFVSLCIALSACSTTPMPQLGERDVPAGWQYAHETEQAWPEKKWWQGFGSNELSEVMAHLDKRNFDIDTINRNLEKATLQLKEQGFKMYPTPVLSLGVDDQYSGSQVSGGSYRDDTQSAVALSLGLSYTDVLSKPTQYNAALASYDRSVAELAEAHLSIRGLAASTYFQILYIRDLKAAAQQNLVNATSVNTIVEARLAAGTITRVDALQQGIVVQREESNLRELEQRELAARASLASLLAMSVSDLKVSEASLNGVVVPSINVGVPLELLFRRPNLAAAEANLRLFRANVDLARHQFLPQLSIDGVVNLSSDSIASLVDQSSLTVTVLGSLTQLLLDNGARSRSVKIIRLDLESALAEYRKEVISALNEVEVSFNNIDLLKSLFVVAENDLARAEEAYRITQLRYEEGVEQFQTLLSIQDALSVARTRYFEAKLAQLNAAIALYQSLGGGWQRSDKNTMLH
ncbi:hypothetical protein GCM10008090_05920 [Arenicella chitinivorans]|uniref:Uncharacterized protein n=1 Tax=Arenicella chitinivorans TaxID=1329800 RepID=A0A918RLS2_9GAMM|nr:TolC family protein [Arenicella chitinivorans]GHA00066.1 hypothetical protein GCM10008090_05920 [Arenicella chitinivorans]